MDAFKEHVGRVVPLDRINVDTDQIIPKQFLKRIERTGFGEFLFNDWRYLENGDPNPEFVLNLPRYAGASILIAGVNFGCGSSREHAPMGTPAVRFQGDPRALICRHLPQQLLQERYPPYSLAGRCYRIAQPRGTRHRGIPTDDRSGGNNRSSVRMAPRTLLKSATLRSTAC